MVWRTDGCIAFKRTETLCNQCKTLRYRGCNTPERIGKYIQEMYAVFTSGPVVQQCGESSKILRYTNMYTQICIYKYIHTVEYIYIHKIYMYLCIYIYMYTSPQMQKFLRFAILLYTEGMEANHKLYNPWYKTSLLGCEMTKCSK